jgi:predicted ArsR family transcriptional regulator
VDRLRVFKALGDNTRYAIYLELARSPVPLSTNEIADSLELHPNTVRPHLERMRDVGLLEVDAGSRGTVGRPQHRYSLAGEAPSLGLEPSSFRMLAGLLAAAASSGGVEPETVADVGRDQGRRAVRARRAARSCVAALEDELAELGFDPAVGDDGKTVAIAFAHCPFRELAEAFPEVVCHLHRGIVEGMVDGYGDVGTRVTRFGTLVDRDPCSVDLAVR